MLRRGAAALALLLLAGCASPAPPVPQAAPAPEAEPAVEPERPTPSATPTTGVLRGRVLDGALRPLAGAQAALPSRDAAATTGPDGAFGFDGLPAGTYLLGVAKPGYRPVRLSVEVRAGVGDPEEVRVVLEGDGRVPFVEETLYRGFVEVSPSVGVLGLSQYLFASCGDRSCIADIPVAGDDLQWLQHEMGWQPTTAAGELMSLACWPRARGRAAGEYSEAIGPSPLVVAFGGDVLRAMDGNGTSECLVTGAAPSHPAGAGLTLLQHFEIRTHVFHGYRPPAGWTYSRDGPAPPPG
jgi:hypothetical protein